MPLKTGAPRGVIVCNRAFNIRKIGARGRNLLPMGFFPYSVLICAKSRLRGFRSTEIHAARAVSAISALQAVARGRHSQRKPCKPHVSAISALQAVARSSTSNTIQAVARNPRSRSGSAQSAQLAQSVQSTRQCPLGSVSAVRAVRAENSALRTFRAIFFERQCVWRGRQCAPINKKPFRETTRARAPPENNCPFF